jgi:hypothetical protein
VLPLWACVTRFIGNGEAGQPFLFDQDIDGQLRAQDSSFLL